MTLSRRSLFKYVGAGTAALTSVPVLAQEKSPKNPYLPEVWDENYDVNFQRFSTPYPEVA